MNYPEQPQHRTAVTLPDILNKVKKATYTVLPDTTTTVCQLHMENGYVILGTSACVDPAKFNQALGEKYAYEDAVNKAWPLEGYLLAQEIFQRGPVKKTYSWVDVANHAQLVDQFLGNIQFKVVMRDGTEFKGAIAADYGTSDRSIEQQIIQDINRQVAEVQA